MPLSVKLTIVPVEMAREQIEAMQRRSDIPAGVVIEDRQSVTSNKSRASNLDAVCGSAETEAGTDVEAATPYNDSFRDLQSQLVAESSVEEKAMPFENSNVQDPPAVEECTELVPPPQEQEQVQQEPLSPPPQEQEQEQQESPPQEEEGEQRPTLYPEEQQEQEQEQEQPPTPTPEEQQHQQQQDEADEEFNLDLNAGNSSRESFGSGLNYTSPEKPIEDDFYAITIESTGKYSRKADLDDIARFAKLEMVDSDKLKEWLKNYMEQNTPDRLLRPNSIPRSAHVKDDLKKGFEAFKSYGWKTIKLNLQPGLIDVKDQWTKETVLEQFQLDYSTDLDKALMEKGDKEVVSYLRKGPIAGHPLAVELFRKGKKSEESQIVTEFRGVDSVVFRIGNNQGAATQDDETGDLVWRDTKKLRALLKDKPLPQKTGKGVSRTVDVLALESYIKVRVYYKAFFTGSVSTDHGNEQFDGRRYWNWELKYLLRYNDIPNAVVMYQDVEMKFYSKVRYNMDNEDWEWVNKNGTWLKQSIVMPTP